MTRAADLGWAWNQKAERPAIEARRVRHASKMSQDQFFRSLAWLELRYKVLKHYGGRCMCCGHTGKTRTLQVDHIKPRIKFPELALEFSNLQVLCKQCNQGKGFKDQTDWRVSEVKSE
jgi:5-methylcytosine-specific restriction endonuclease McrA